MLLTNSNFHEEECGPRLEGSGNRENTSDIAQSLLNELQKISSDFDSSVNLLEERFVNTCRWFGGLINDTSQYGKEMSSAYCSLLEAFNEDFRNRLNTQILQINQQYSTSAEQVENGLVTLNELRCEMTQVMKTCEKTISDLDVLRTCAVGMKIECAGSTKANMVFDRFPNQVEDVVNQILTRLRTIQEDSFKVNSGLLNESKELESIADSLCSTNTSVGQGVELLPGYVRELTDCVSVMVSDGESQGQKISKLASEGVYYLQFGDIVRQKSEHILEVFHKIVEFFKTENLDANELTGISEAIHVQCGQLSSLVNETSEAVDRMEFIVNSLIETVDEKESSESNNIKNLFDKVTVDLQHLASAITSTMEATGAIDNSLSYSINTIQSMSRHRKDIWTVNGRLWLLAKNTTIKATKFGTEGLVFRTLSDEICGFQAMAEKVIKDLDESFQKAEEKARGLISMDENEIAGFTQKDEIRIRESITKLVNLRKQLDKTRLDSNIRANQLRTEIYENNQVLKNLREMAQSLEIHHVALSAFSEQVQSHISQLNTSNIYNSEGNGFLNSEHYTMDSEREICHEVTQGKHSGKHKATLRISDGDSEEQTEKNLNQNTTDQEEELDDLEDFFF